MGIKARENSVAAWSFLVGVILAITIGVATAVISSPQFTVFSNWVYAILAVIGIIIGFANVVGKETQTFLIASVSLVIVSKFGMDSLSVSIIGIEAGKIGVCIFAALFVLFVPATIIVALKTVFSTASV